MSFPPAQPHDPIEEVAPDLFMVRGCIPLNPLMKISRNMAIVREDRSLVEVLRILRRVRRQLALVVDDAGAVGIISVEEVVRALIKPTVAEG